LNLNGNGKTAGNGPLGALQIEISSGDTTTFHNPVVLQTTSNINVALAGSTGVLEKAVSGPGGLIKSGGGKLTLLDLGGSSSYTGNTEISTGGGTLSLSNAFLAPGSDVTLPTTGGTLDLTFSGTNRIHSLIIGTTPQAPGTYGSATSGANFTSAMFSGSGKLFVPVPGDYNDNGVVDAADYVMWRKGGPLQNEVDTPGTVNDRDYVEWRTRFGNALPGSASSLSAAPIPEPSTMILLISIVPLIAGRKLGRKRT
jgi:hypothetical protein